MNIVLACSFFGCFLGVSVVNLICGFNEWEKPRRLSKPFCLLFLALTAVCLRPTEPLIYVGAFLGMIGDVFLLYKRNRFLLVLGGISFLAGHLCYIAAMLLLMGQAGQLNWPVWGYMLLVLLVLEIVMIPSMYFLTKKSKPFTIIGVFYSSILISVALIALQGICWGWSRWLSLIFCGALCFIASDITLTTTLFRHDLKRRDFWIMLTYLLGEVLIVGGLIFTVA